MEIATFAKVLSVAAAMLASLVPSVQPFYPAQAWAAVPGLEGRYSPMRVAGETGKPRETFVFVKQPWNDPPSYTLTVTKDGASGKFQVAAFQLEGADPKVFFLDLTSEEGAAGGGLAAAHLLRTHSAARVQVVKDGLELAFLDKAALVKRRDAGKLPILMDSDAYGGVLLTGRTAELQALLRSASAEGLFVGHSLLRR